MSAQMNIKIPPEDYCILIPTLMDEIVLKLRLALGLCCSRRSTQESTRRICLCIDLSHFSEYGQISATIETMQELLSKTKYYLITLSLYYP